MKRFLVKYIEKAGYPTFRFTTDSIDSDSLMRMDCCYFLVRVTDTLSKKVIFSGGCLAREMGMLIGAN